MYSSCAADEISYQPFSSFGAAPVGAVAANAGSANAEKTFVNAKPKITIFVVRFTEHLPQVEKARRAIQHPTLY
jgi:hypothetical protein